MSENSDEDLSEVKQILLEVLIELHEHYQVIADLVARVKKLESKLNDSNNSNE